MNRPLPDPAGLLGVSNILDLLHYRNKNQHGRSAWFKWLSMLKRCIPKLIEELDQGAEIHSRSRINYMNKFLLPKAYVCFTRLVCDNQFSALGMVMVAELSLLRVAIGIESSQYLTQTSSLKVGKQGTGMIGKSFGYPLVEDLGQAIKGPVHGQGDGPGSTALPSMTGLPYQPHPLNKAAANSVGTNTATIAHLTDEANPQLQPQSLKSKRWKSINLIDEIFEGLN